MNDWICQYLSSFDENRTSIRLKIWKNKSSISSWLLPGKPTSLCPSRQIFNIILSKSGRSIWALADKVEAALHICHCNQGLGTCVLYLYIRWSSRVVTDEIVAYLLINRLIYCWPGVLMNSVAINGEDAVSMDQLSWFLQGSCQSLMSPSDSSHFVYEVTFSLLIVPST